MAAAAFVRTALMPAMSSFGSFGARPAGKAANWPFSAAWRSFVQGLDGSAEIQHHEGAGGGADPAARADAGGEPDAELVDRAQDRLGHRIVAGRGGHEQRAERVRTLRLGVGRDEEVGDVLV